MIKPAYLMLTENIVFEPNADDGLKPLPNQEEYESPPYHLGFFAAIAMGGRDVVLELNGYTIQ